MDGVEADCCWASVEEGTCVRFCLIIGSAETEVESNGNGTNSLPVPASMASSVRFANSLAFTLLVKGLLYIDFEIALLFACCSWVPLITMSIMLEGWIRVASCRLHVSGISTLKSRTCRRNSCVTRWRRKGVTAVGSPLASCSLTRSGFSPL